MARKRVRFFAGFIAMVVTLFVLGEAANTAFLYRAIIDLMLGDAEASSKVVLYQARDVMGDYAALPWLLDYWQSHVQEMDLPGDPARRSSEIMRLLLDYGIDGVQNVTTEQAGAFRALEQRQFAEYCYLDIMARYVELKKYFDLDNLYCVSMAAMDKAQAIFDARTEEETAANGNLYALGANWPITLSLHPAITEMYELREDRAYFEMFTSTVDHEEYMSGYLPVLEAGSIRCHICVSFSLTELRQNIYRQVRKIELIDIVVMASAFTLLGALLYRSFLRSLGVVQSAVHAYRETKDSKAVVNFLKAFRGKNEVGQLADDFYAMTVELDRYTDEMVRLSAEQERIGTELSLAAKIQADTLPGVFPAFPERTEFDIYASMDPAKTVGGDFYDFYLIDEHHLGIVIADVSGKGIPAALFMMKAKLLVQNDAMTGCGPAEVLEAVNQQICAGNREKMFVTVWFGILDTRTGEIAAANAGHFYPAVMMAGGRFELFKDKHGIAAGVVDGFHYQEYTLTLTPGSKLFLYTDGVTEATNASQQMFRMERMLAALNENTAASP